MWLEVSKGGTTTMLYNMEAMRRALREMVVHTYVSSC